MQHGDLRTAHSAYTSALAASEQFGEHDYRLCWTLEALSDVLERLRLYQIAEPYRLRALGIRRRILGPWDLSVGGAADALARMYYNAAIYDKAEMYAKKCAEIYEKTLGEEHKDLATVLTNLATLYHKQGNYQEAETYYKRAIAIRTRVLGAQHPDTCRVQKSYADLLCATNRIAEAAQIYPSATGQITGSWKVLSIPENNQLNTAQPDVCLFCGSPVKGQDKCRRCGTVSGKSV